MNPCQEMLQNLEKSGTSKPSFDQLDWSLNLNAFELSLMREIISDADIGTVLQHHQSKSPENSAQFLAICETPPIVKDAVDVSQNRDFTAGQCNNVVSVGKDHRPPPLAKDAFPPSLPARRYKGVYRRPSGNFSVELGLRNPGKRGKRLWLGTYNTAEEAAMAYDRAAFKDRGSDATLNFPDLLRTHSLTPEKDSNKKLSPWMECSPSSQSPDLSIKNPHYVHIHGEFKEQDGGVDFDQPQRPQQKGKKRPNSFTSGQRIEKLLKTVSEFTEVSNINKQDFDDKKRDRAKLEEVKMEKLRILEDKMREKRREIDMKFYIQSHDHLTGVHLNMVLARKQEIAQRWGWKM
ncbi:hypothetical protein LXL04_022806 [Taraxacum kok-saghyz]